MTTAGTAGNGRKGKTVKETTVDTEKGAAKEDSSKPKAGEHDFTALPASGESDEQGAIELHHPGEIEVAETIYDGGLRPIAASHLDIYGTLMGRPISASHLRVVSTDMMPGHRPVFASNLHILNSMELAGNRPIVASSPELMAGSGLPGGRPIASNEDFEEGDGLMGYLD